MILSIEKLLFLSQFNQKNLNIFKSKSITVWIVWKEAEHNNVKPINSLLNLEFKNYDE